MSNVTIFKNPNAVSRGTRELSALAKTLIGSSGNVNRRIQSNANGTFKRLVNGEVIGSPVRGELNVIILDLLPKVSRTYYKSAYDTNNPTLPDCWSNLGDKPEAASPNPQHTNCADCPMNVKGSGANGARACRFQRRIAVLVEGDRSGDVYQFNIPAKSIFGKGVGNVHPFESYLKFLVANNESPDGVVTNIKFDDNADTMEFLFSPVRAIDEEEAEMVRNAQANPQTKRYTMLTVGQVDGVKKAPPAENAPAIAAKPVEKVSRSEEPDDVEEDVPPPVKRESKKQETPKDEKLASVLSDWSATK
jgi:hypothetical protein